MWNILDFQWIQTVFVPEDWDVTPTSNRPHHTHTRLEIQVWSVFSVAWSLFHTGAFRRSGNQHQADAPWLEHPRERHFLFLLLQTSASVATPCYHDNHILLERVTNT